MAKTEMLMIKVSPEEKSQIAQEAGKVGLSMSAFILLLVRQWSDGIKFEREKKE